MEELLELTKKQLKFQKMITACLSVIIILLIIAGIGMASRMNEMTQSMNMAIEKIENIDVDGINDAISSTNEVLESTNALLESTEKFSQAVDALTSKVQEFDNWVGNLFK